MIAPLALSPLPIPLDGTRDGVLMGAGGLLAFAVGCGLLSFLDEAVKEFRADLIDAVDLEVRGRFHSGEMGGISGMQNRSSSSSFQFGSSSSSSGGANQMRSMILHCCRCVS